MIEKISAGDVIVASRKSLGMTDTENVIIDDEHLIALVRRSAGIHCPCSRATLRISLVESLQFLADSEELLVDRIDQVIEGLIVAGDLLELHDVSILDPSIKGTWVFAAPPRYVVRDNDEILLMGIVPDQDIFLPYSLASRIHHRGFLRSIMVEEGENLESELKEQGLQRLSEETWFRCPKQETSYRVLDRYTRRLAQTPESNSVLDFVILDYEKPVKFYSGRWTTCGRKTGIFVGRRPQEYGASIWCFVELKSGRVVRFLDLPITNSLWRGCDDAWFLQMAIDAERGNPQLYRVQIGSTEWRFDFFSPLPVWSERRLATFGKSVSREKCLLSYVLPNDAAKIEERFLHRHLWLSRTENYL